MKSLKRSVSLILGRTGGGKTNFARGLFRRERRALLLDADFQEFPALYFDSADALLDWFEDNGAYERAGLPFRVGYTPLYPEWPTMLAAAEKLGPVNIYIEEADRLDDPRVFPEYDELLTRGRHFGVSLTLLGLHPVKLPKDARRQCTRLVCFQQIDPDDIDYLRHLIGDEADKLAHLKPFHYLDWTPQDGACVCPPCPLTK